MIIPLFISIVIIVINILIHGYGTLKWLQFIAGKFNKIADRLSFKQGIFVLSSTAVILMMLHFLEIAIWAISYWIIPQINNLETFEESLYFSLVTFTTVGYGDITILPKWRIMCGFEAMSGILLFGWSTAIFISAVNRIYSRMKHLKSLLDKLKNG